MIAGRFSKVKSAKRAIAGPQRGPLPRAVLIAGAVAAGFCWLPSPTGGASAETISNAIGVTANLLPSCSVEAGSLVFGYTGVADEVAGQNLYVSCSGDLPVTLAVDSGQNVPPVVGATQFAMNNGANLLNYELYTDSSLSAASQVGAFQAWTPTLIALPSIVVGQYYTVLHGRIPAGQTVAGGTYSDVLTITIAW